MSNKIAFRDTKELAQAIHETWCEFQGVRHSSICKIGALDAFYQAMGARYKPQESQYKLGTAEFDAYYLGVKLAFEYVDIVKKSMRERTY